MSALDSLSLRNGLKTTSTVLGKQQSGLDAAQKANPQETAAQMNMNTAQAMLHGKEASLTPPKDVHDQAVRMNQETAEGMLRSQTQMKKQEDHQQEEKPRQMSYAEMFKMLNPEETPEQKARREKRERAKMRIAAIGDGLRALSNMYFAAKGAKVVHDPKSDLTVANQKRLEALKGERDKNKSAWLNGYLKAQALDEEARKNKENLAEQVRYHDQLAKNRDRVGDQKDRSLGQTDTRLQQSQQKIELTGDRLNEMVRHNKESEQIAQQNANSRSVTAAKAGNGRRATATTKAQQQWCYDKVVEFANSSDENAKKVLKAIASVGGKQLNLNSASGVYNIINGYGKKSSKGSGGKGKGKTSSSSSNNNFASGLSFKKKK